MIKTMNYRQAEEKESGTVYRHAAEKKRWGENLARNCAFAGILTLMVVSVRNAELPTGQTVLTAVQQMIDANWDSSLGKISFVSNLLPESMAVFFESDLQAELTAPCFGSVIHAWSETEPYLGYNADNGSVYAVSAGQVMSVAHGLEEERVEQVRTTVLQPREIEREMNSLIEQDMEVSHEVMTRSRSAGVGGGATGRAGD